MGIGIVAYINSSWKRFTAVGCSHGHLADPLAIKTVLSFNDRWKPHTRIHLGDYVDTAAYRSGAKGTKDEKVSLETDFDAGLSFIRSFDPTHLTNGNHCIRVWKAAKGDNAIVREFSQYLINKIEKAVPKKCTFIRTYDTNSFIELGGTKFLHGIWYSEDAVRQHAEHYGKCVIAHLHKVMSVPGRRQDGAKCYCVGFLGEKEKFGYAKLQRSYSQWQQGFGYGEYNDKECVVWLAERNIDGSWKLPL